MDATTMTNFTGKDLHALTTALVESRRLLYAFQPAVDAGYPLLKSFNLLDIDKTVTLQMLLSLKLSTRLRNVVQLSQQPKTLTRPKDSSDLRDLKTFMRD
jgi:hypothetical protein